MTKELHNKLVNKFGSIKNGGNTFLNVKLFIAIQGYSEQESLEYAEEYKEYLNKCRESYKAAQERKRQIKVIEYEIDEDVRNRTGHGLIATMIYNMKKAHLEYRLP